MFQHNDIITDGKDTRRVLGVCDDVIYISSYANLDEVGYPSTESYLLKDGYKLVSMPWEPKVGEKCWTISGEGESFAIIWSGSNSDIGRQKFFGVFESEEKAKARIAEIKKLLA